VDKYVRFNIWAKENGVRAESLEYPAVFGKGLVGIAAKSRVSPDEAFLFVPASVLINDQRIQQSALGPIIGTHPEVFFEHIDGEYLRIIFFVIWEMCKGEQSFWAPYFAIVEETDLPIFWDQD